MMKHSFCCAALVLVCGLTGCQAPWDPPARTPVVVVMNDQGTPQRNVGSAVSSVVPVATPTTGPNPNLVQNSDFSSEWTTGWERATGPISGQSIVELISASQSSSGKAVRIVHDGANYLAIKQLLPVPSPNVRISVKINPSADTPCRGILKACTGQAGIIIAIYGKDMSDGKELGQLAYLYPGNNAKFRQSSTAQLRFIFLEPGWQTISIPNLQQAVINSLPNVKADAIKAIQINIVAGSIGGCDPGTCYAEVQATDVQVMVNN